MRKPLFAVLMGSLLVLAAVADDAAPGENAGIAEKGKMLMASDGARLGQVYRVAADGSVQLILDGRMVSVPASTLSLVGGKLTTSLTKRDLIAH